MATSLHNPHFTLLILSLTLPLLALSINITSLLSSYPDLSDFNDLLTSSSVAQDLIQRSSLTLLAVPNAYFRSSDLNRSSPPNIADVLRYHVLLQYFTPSDLNKIQPNGELVTTLYQTTGRANGNLGAVNITRNVTSSVITVRSPVSYSPLNITILSLIKTLPYNVSIFSVDALLIPYGFDIMASENQPPMGVNITRALINGHNFNVAAAMLTASGVTEEFEEDEMGAGITMFVPTDDAFGELPVTEQFQSLPADQKLTVLRFHVLETYYPLGSLELIVNPVQATIATQKIGAGRFTLNITRVNGSVGLDTGIVQATITQTVFDQSPVAIFAVSKVLLPKEIFGKQALGESRPGRGNAEPEPPEISFAPGLSPGFDNTIPPSQPGFNDKPRSNSVAIDGGLKFSFLFCILVYVLV